MQLRNRGVLQSETGKATRQARAQTDTASAPPSTSDGEKAGPICIRFWKTTKYPAASQKQDRDGVGGGAWTLGVKDTFTA